MISYAKAIYCLLLLVYKISLPYEQSRVIAILVAMNFLPWNRCANITTDENIIDLKTTGQDPRERCEDVITGLQRKPEEILVQEDKINAYLPSEVVCFFCPIRSSNGIAHLKFPLYHKLLEFGFIGKYFPEKITVIIFFGIICEVKVEIYREAESVFLYLYECYIHDAKCKRLPSWDGQRLFYNNIEFCVHVALSFHHPSRIYYSFSYRCFALTDFRRNNWVFHAKKDCGKRNSTLWAYFSIIPAENQSIEGVPIILPCSSGGYTVNSDTGRYLTTKTCNPFYWESLRRTEDLNGTDFVIKYTHNSSKYLLFPIRNHTIPYPKPLYLRDNGTPLSVEEVAPRVLNDFEYDEHNTFKCPLLRRLDEIGTKGDRFAAKIAPGTSGEESAASEGYFVSCLDVEEFVFIYIFLILIELF